MTENKLTGNNESSREISEATQYVYVYNGDMVAVRMCELRIMLKYATFIM